MNCTPFVRQIYCSCQRAHNKPLSKFLIFPLVIPYSIAPSFAAVGFIRRFLPLDSTTPCYRISLPFPDPMGSAKIHIDYTTPPSPLQQRTLQNSIIFGTAMLDRKACVYGPMAHCSLHDCSIHLSMKGQVNFMPVFPRFQDSTNGRLIPFPNRPVAVVPGSECVRCRWPADRYESY